MLAFTCILKFVQIFQTTRSSLNLSESLLGSRRALQYSFSWLLVLRGRNSATDCRWAHSTLSLPAPEVWRAKGNFIHNHPLLIQHILFIFFFLDENTWLHSYLLDPTRFQTKPRKPLFIHTIVWALECDKISSISTVLLDVFTQHSIAAQSKFCALPLLPKKGKPLH